MRESGAFLLGRRGASAATVVAFQFYDDVDPQALSTGIVRLSGAAMNRVWERCGALALEVVADVHTHPAGSGQSGSDRAHPMVGQRGHVALILPNFARSALDLAGVGVYRYLGSKQWETCPPPRIGWFQVIF